MEQQQQEHYQQINQQKPNTFKNESFELIKTLIIFCMIYFVTKGYIAQPFLVKGRSMEQTLSDGDYLIVDQLTYNFTAPKRFEVVVFHTEFIPGGSGGEYYIKRVIGVPGDRVVIKEGKVILYENNSDTATILDEKYIIDGLKTIAKEPVDVVLQDNQYFVLGDNRGNSSDSRFWGPVDKSYIVGKPFIRLFPFNTIKVFLNN
ncbi:signal peptidase I [bacterium]|nr:signal peptidase I [Candidatus Elulimicrobium humile]